MSQSSLFDARIRRSVESSIATMELLRSDAALLATVSRVCEAILQAFRQKKKIVLFGNGGSASDAQHISAEFVGRFAFDRPALPALCLVEGISTITAIGNDHGFDQVFSRQVEGVAVEGDVAIGISTSGNSSNVLNAISTANKMGVVTVGLTGKSGGKLRALANECICAPSDEIPRIQECHTLVGHVISEIVEQELFGRTHSAAHT